MNPLVQNPSALAMLQVKDGLPNKSATTASWSGASVVHIVVVVDVVVVEVVVVQLAPHMNGQTFFAKLS